MGDATVHYDLEVPMYELLRAEAQIPCLLVVLVLPEDESLWLSQSVEELIVRRCAFWYSLRGASPTTATSKVRIHIPLTQVFSVDALRSFVHRAVRGEVF